MAVGSIVPRAARSPSGPDARPYDALVTPTSFTELHGDVVRRRGVGDVGGAIALLREHAKTFPLHRGVLQLLLAEVLVAAERPKEAIDSLQEAFAAGCRYKAEWLTKNAALAPLQGDQRLTRLVRKLDERYVAEAAAARPDLLIRAPAGQPGPDGRPLLIALHGNNSNARETARYWSSAVNEGWVVAIPQSSEIGASPGAFTWNDRARLAREIPVHIARAKERHRIDGRRIVSAGFSMGGYQALALPLALGMPARGVIAVAAWLPDARALAPLIAPGAARGMRAYVVVGDADPSYRGATELVELLSAAGAMARLDTRAGLGHEYPADMDATLTRALAMIAGT